MHPCAVKTAARLPARHIKSTKATLWWVLVILWFPSERKGTQKELFVHVLLIYCFQKTFKRLVLSKTERYLVSTDINQRKVENPNVYDAAIIVRIIALKLLTVNVRCIFCYSPNH